jgi:hypothetical protein
MKLTYFPKQTAQNAEPVMQAFLAGCQRIGIKTVENNERADVAVIWSMLWAGRMRENQRIWNKFRSSGRPVVVLEVGGLRRGHTWRVGLNGVNGQGYFGVPATDDLRAKELGLQLTPWRTDGGPVLICMQRRESQQWGDMPEPVSWLDSTIQQLRRFTDRHIIVRPHPRQRIEGLWPNVSFQYPQKLENTYDCYDFDPFNAWAVINWNSNPGMQSVIAGVPAFVGPDSLAKPVANSDYSQIENPRMPDRQQWVNNLAYTEWTLPELYSGIPQSRILSQ